MMARQNITDRAKRYRAQSNVTGPRKCVLCGARADLGVMHLTGDENHGEKANLAYGCRSCNMKLAAAFKRIGAGRPTNQYNPSSGVPTFEQYAWAVSSGEREHYPNSTRHKAGAHDEAGAIIHATPKHKRIEYAKRIARSSQGTRRARSQESLDRWNPGAMNATTAKHEKEIWAYIEAKIAAGKTAEEIYRAVWRRWGYQGQAKDGAVHLKMHDGVQVFQVNPAGRPYKVAGGWEYWLHDGNVYRNQVGNRGTVGPEGIPLNARWESTLDHFKKHNPGWFSRPDARRTTPATGGIAYHMAKSGKRASTAGESGGGGRRKSAKKAASDRGLSIPDEATMQAGFKRGLSLREILGNPAGKRWMHYSDRLLREMLDLPAQQVGESEKTSIRRELEKRAARRDNPGERMTRAEALERAANPATAKVNWNLIARLPADGKVYDGGPEYGAFNVRHTPADRMHVEMLLAETGIGLQRRRAVSSGKGKPKKWAASELISGRLNPASAAAEVFEEFHGFAPSEVVTVTKQIHYHEHLAAAGKLTSLGVWGVDEQGHAISGFKGAILAFNESKNQLFVEGGDQRINLADYGVDSPHELETLGRVTDIGYFGKKTHLGDEGGEAVYVHKFRTTNNNGRHVVVKVARFPDLIYDVRNESLLFSGGSYEILAEGINQ